MIEKLNEILLSENVVARFHEEYKRDDFREWLNGLLPEVRACADMAQDNPWHIYNCLDHILHAVQEMNRMTKGLDGGERRMLAYTMFLHDLGKPECYIRRYSKLYKREVDSFFNHNLASERIAGRVLPKLGFTEKECEIIKLLVREHDIFMFITLDRDGNPYHKALSEGLINDYIEKFNAVGDGRQILQYLIMVGRADNRAQNPEMTGESLRMLDVMEEMIKDSKNAQEI